MSFLEPLMIIGVVVLLFLAIGLSSIFLIWLADKVL